MKFYPKESVNDPSVLSSIFSEMHEVYKKRKESLTQEQIKQLIQVMMATDEQIDKMYTGLSETFPIGGFFLRCGIFPIKYEKRLLLFIALTTYEFNIGGMILVGYYVQWRIRKLMEEHITTKNEIDNIGILSLDMACEKIFPFGVFTQEIVHEFWDKQKVAASPDNLIDHPSAAASFIPYNETESINT